MPVSGSYEWDQTDDTIELSIPLKGVSPKLVDILLTEIYLKVSYRPFLLEIDLLHPVDETKSQAVLKDGSLLISLVKSVREDNVESSMGIWKGLLYEDESKDNIRRRRAQSVLKREERLKVKHENVKNMRLKEERMTLRNQVNENLNKLIQT